MLYACFPYVLSPNTLTPIFQSYSGGNPAVVEATRITDALEGIRETIFTSKNGEADCM